MVKIVLLVLAVLLMTGCSQTVEIELRIEAPPPLSEYLPRIVFLLEVGLEAPDVEPVVAEIEL